MRKLQFVVFVLAAGLIAAIANSSSLGAGLHRAGSTRNRPHHLAPARADSGSALSGPAGLHPHHAATDAVQARARWRTVRSELAAELAAARRARAAHRRPRPVTLRLCRRYQHVAAVGARGAGLVVRNDNYGGRRECLANKNRWANFAVASSAARRKGPEPAAFPNIFYGCSWGVCSPGTKLPRRVSRLREPVTSWYTAGRPAGRWDAAYDIWFARKRHTSGQDHGAEIMLWLRSKGLGRPGGHGLLIERQRWQLEHWVTTNPATGEHWPLIIFRLIHPRGYVRHLSLMPFFRRVETLGLLDRSWWLTAVEAGFEVWRGGAGLRTTSFWIHLK
ncbi:MAG TPA: hypothetical protein VFQ44_03245 [Streptosporangiaceae bacterium]|nr:hypothetical protein [Streptosporangiaceae bacterium]